MPETIVSIKAGIQFISLSLHPSSQVQIQHAKYIQEIFIEVKKKKTRTRISLIDIITWGGEVASYSKNCRQQLKGALLELKKTEKKASPGKSTPTGYSTPSGHLWTLDTWVALYRQSKLYLYICEMIRSYQQLKKKKPCIWEILRGGHMGMVQGKRKMIKFKKKLNNIIKQEIHYYLMTCEQPVYPQIP